MTFLSFRGFIRDIHYVPRLNPQLKAYDISEFDINSASTYGLITLGSLENNLAFSKWVSPKRTRSYPFARIYNTYHLNTKKITIIPIIKDEGSGTSNNDRINFITLSWMNLLNVYIILGWYETADVVKKSTNKITNQKFNSTYIREKLLEISRYQMTALHWNTTHFEREFEPVFFNAVNSYKNIARQQSVELHSTAKHLEVLQKFQSDGRFNLEIFKRSTLLNSQAAANREIMTTHTLEYLEDGAKGLFTISNYLGGEYHLTADEVYREDDLVIIQESKNSSRGKLPSEDDIKDGLFKLILFANLETLFLGNEQVSFTTRLKITGNLVGSISLPNATSSIDIFCQQNRFSLKQRQLIELLNLEASSNPKLSIMITSRHSQ